MLTNIVKNNVPVYGFANLLSSDSRDYTLSWTETESIVVMFVSCDDTFYLLLGFFYYYVYLTYVKKKSTVGYGEIRN